MGHIDGEDDGIGYGVAGRSYINGYGVYGASRTRHGVHGFSPSGIGMYGFSESGTGAFGLSNTSYGMYGRSYTGVGVFGESVHGFGVRAFSQLSIGVDAWGYPGVYGSSDYGPGVIGHSKSGDGVIGRSYSSYGVYGYSNSGFGIYGGSASGHAAYLDGNVRIIGNLRITGNLQKGGGSFKIDHPLDPANKYLSHSFVESPDMKNVYDGVVVLDDKGEAVIDLPDWFAALNKDFRYQLTAIGAPGPNLYIAEEIIFSDSTTNYSDSSDSNNNNSRFKIAGGTSGMKVSWQVTGIRKDPWANANRIEIEQDKPANEQGYYLHPDVYGQPQEKGISHLLFPPQEEEDKKKWQEEQRIINK